MIPLTTEPCGCGTDTSYITGFHDTPIGEVPKVSPELTSKDKIGAFKVRWAFSRMNYKVVPGLYALGNPDKSSPVLASANYKLSFDMLRKELKGLDAWILVLDTKGINVWCAAGKGTFGTKELVIRIRASKLQEIVDHHKVIVPQLGAPGVAAHKVKKMTGFSVVYGPIKASDIPQFLSAGMKATPEMRRVTFSFYERLVLIPVEFIMLGKKLLFTLLVFIILSGIHAGGYSLTLVRLLAPDTIINLLITFVAGIILGPLMLPYLPSRSFGIKGVVIGLVAFAAAFGLNLTGTLWVEQLGWFLLMTALSSFLLLTFTGSTPYTNLSGVKKEMRIGIPMQVSGAALGLVFWIASHFLI